jgi:hypothetical protein
MLGSLSAIPLTHDMAAQVLPLARSLLPALELEAWLAFARARIDRMPSGGIMGVQDRRGYFHGLLGFEVRGDLLDGTVLDVGWATATDLLNRAGAAAVLSRELEAMAARLNCAGVQVRLRPEQQHLRRWLEDEGHVLRSLILEKPVVARGA